MPPDPIDDASDFRIEFQQRKKLISSHPIFNALSPELIDELSNLTHEKHFAPGQIVVSQNDIVDAVYFIAKGEVEVDREVHDKGYCVLVPQAILREGETIGLNRIGFFSETGVRTATLKAITECVVIGWDLNTLNTYLQNHPTMNASMRKASEILQRINFIKQVEPFADLPKERLSWLSTNIQEIKVLAGTILFKAGDIGDECYLVRSGEVEITVANKDGTLKKLAIIVPPMLFGETALLTSNKRNANAEMTRTGNLLVIKKDQLDELMQHTSTTESMMLLSVERCRPIQSEGIEYYKRKSDEGGEIVILKDTVHGKYFKLSEDGWYIWQHLDGTNTLQDLAVELFKEKRVFCPEAIADTIFNLSNAGFVQLPEVPFILNENPEENPSLWSRFRKKMSRVFCVEFIFDDIDTGLTSTYDSGVYLLYTLIGKALIAVSIVIGVMAFGLFAHEAFIQTQFTHHLLFIVILVIIFNLLSVLIHEFAHAYTTKYFKYEVRRAGIIFYWVNLIAFIDTSDLWLSDKRTKIIVSLAGPIADLSIAGFASLLAVAIPTGNFALFLWFFALSLYYGVFKNLNPFMENDGYFVIKDIYDHPNLREDSIQRLFLINQPAVKSKRGVVTYLLTCAIFLVMDVAIALLFQHYLRLFLPETILGISTLNLIWILPSLVLAKYVINTWILLRRIKINSR